MRTRFLAAFTSPWLILLAAFAFRVAFLLYKSHLIPAAVLADVPFQNEAGNVASALAQGHGFCCLFRQSTGPTAWLAPVYPLLLALIFKLFGVFTLNSFCAAVLLNCLFSSLACLPLFAMGKRMGSTATASLAAWLWAVFPAGIILPFEWIWDTSLSALLAAALLWGTLELPRSPQPRNFALYGLLWALTLLTNPALGILIPFLLGWIVYQRRDRLSQHLRMAFLALGLLLLVCAPWMARNYVHFHRFIPFRANFPYEFWSGNNEIFDERSRAINRITRYEQIHLYASLGENAFLESKWQQAAQFVRSHPSLYAQLFGKRIVATWLGTPSPWHDFLQTDSTLAKFLILWNALTLLGVLAGLARLFLRQRQYFFPVAAFPLIFPITFYIAHTSLRHRHPCDSVLALLLAVALAGAGIRQRAD